MKIFELFGRIAIDNEDAKGKIDETSQKANSFSQTLRKGIATAAKWGTTIATAAVATIATVGKKINEMATETAERANEIDKLSQQMGLSAQAFQEWQYAFEQSGLDSGTMEGAIASLLEKMTAVNEGSKDAIKLFDELGFSCFDSSGNMKDAELIFEQVIMALANMTDETERTQLAMEIFGGDGEKMGALLNEGAKGIENFKDRAHELGIVISDDYIEKGVKFNETLHDTNLVFDTMKDSIGYSVMDPLQKFYDFLLDSTPTIKDTFESWGEFLGAATEIFVNSFIWLFDDTEDNKFNKSLKRIDETLEETIASAEAENTEILTLIDTIDMLSGKTTLTREESEKWEAAVERLIELVPEFKGVINEETREIEGGTEALRKRAEELKKLAIEEAKQKALQGKYDAVAEAYEKIGKWQLEVDIQQALLDKKNAEIEAMRTEYERMEASYVPSSSTWGAGSWENGYTWESSKEIRDEWVKLNAERVEIEEKLAEAKEDLAELTPTLKEAEEALEIAKRSIEIGMASPESAPKHGETLSEKDLATVETSLKAIAALMAQVVRNTAEGRNIVLDSGVLVGALMGAANTAFGAQIIRNERGN